MPTNNYFLPLTSDTFDSSEIKAAKHVLDSGNYSMGEQVILFEKEFSDYVGAKNAVMVNSGSSANLLMTFAMTKKFRDSASLHQGDEVLIPALLWPTTLWPIYQAGLKPVLVDINPDTLNMCLIDALSKITNRTKAVFYIHVLGNSKHAHKLHSFCDQQKLILIEDCCESLGATNKSKHVGNFGICGSFSHFFSHHLTTMEGGTVITSDDALADDLRSMRAHGWIRDRSDRIKIEKELTDISIDPRWSFYMPGFNVRPMEIQAAIGRVQLKKLDDLLKQRKDFVATVGNILAQIDWITIIGDENDPSYAHSWMNIPIRMLETAKISRNSLKLMFEQHGIETRPIISGNFMKHSAAKYIDDCGPFPNVDKIDLSSFMIAALPTKSKSAIDALAKLVIELKKI